MKITVEELEWRTKGEGGGMLIVEEFKENLINHPIETNEMLTSIANEQGETIGSLLTFAKVNVLVRLMCASR